MCWTSINEAAANLSSNLSISAATKESRDLYLRTFPLSAPAVPNLITRKSEAIIRFSSKDIIYLPWLDNIVHWGRDPVAVDKRNCPVRKIFFESLDRTFLQPHLFQHARRLAIYDSYSQGNQQVLKDVFKFLGYFEEVETLYMVLGYDPEDIPEGSDIGTRVLERMKQGFRQWKERNRHVIGELHEPKEIVLAGKCPFPE